MLDQKINKQINEFLQKEKHSENEILDAANLLLRINKNRFLHTSIMRKPFKFESKLMYELNKHYQVRIQPEVEIETNKMLENVLPHTQDIVSNFKESQKENSEVEFKGKREDHNELPEEIQAIYDLQLKRIQSMRSVHEKIKLCNQSTTPICDRHELASLLVELDKTYAQEWEKYDHYKIGSEEEGSDSNSENVELTKQIQAARAYITRAKKDIPKLEGDKKTSKISKTQERIDFLLEHKIEMEDETIAELKELGLKF